MPPHMRKPRPIIVASAIEKSDFRTHLDGMSSSLRGNIGGLIKGRKDSRDKSRTRPDLTSASSDYGSRCEYAMSWHSIGGSCRPWIFLPRYPWTAGAPISSPAVHGYPPTVSMDGRSSHLKSYCSPPICIFREMKDHEQTWNNAAATAVDFSDWPSGSPRLSIMHQMCLSF